MRRIMKGAPPAVLADLRRTPDLTWEGVHGDQKQAMRDAALEEQRGLCAYCNARIRSDSSTLEHWVPRSLRDSDPLAWEHLLAVCEGGQGESELHGDKRRGDRALSLHPARRPPDTEAVVRYLADGRVSGSTPEWSQEIDAVLGLNAVILKRARRQAIDAALGRVRGALGQPTRARRIAGLRALLVPYLAPSGDMPPYPMAVLPLVRPVLAREASRNQRLRKLPRP